MEMRLEQWWLQNFPYVVLPGGKWIVKELQATCLEAVFCVDWEQFSKDAFIHSLTTLRNRKLFILKILFY